MPDSWHRKKLYGRPKGSRQHSIDDTCENLLLLQLWQTTTSAAGGFLLIRGYPVGIWLRVKETKAHNVVFLSPEFEDFAKLGPKAVVISDIPPPNLLIVIPEKNR